MTITWEEDKKYRLETEDEAESLKWLGFYLTGYSLPFVHGSWLTHEVSLNHFSMSIFVWPVFSRV